MAFTRYLLLSGLVASCLPLALSAALPKKAEYNPQPSGPLAVRANEVVYIGSSNPTYGVDTWLGLRYAKPPTGPLRLQPPQGIEVEGTVNASDFGPSCFQLVQNHTGQSEDCLYLNIFKPSHGTLPKHSRHKKLKNLPVMLWIHGGGFNDGTSSIYHAESLVQRSAALNTPVIVITINYRLSFFGFSAGTEAIAHNALNLGLLDQRQALKWVSKHIACFGGDPEKVTIFGQSAGATSIGLQITAFDGNPGKGEPEDGLFRAAILESGSPQDTAPTPPPTWGPYQKAWDSVAALVGCANASSVFACIQGVPSADLFTAITTVGISQAPLPSSTFPWQPVVDDYFVSDFPSKLLKEGKFAKVPVIVGFTTDELTYVIPTNLNISSDLVLEFLAETVLPFVPKADIEQLLTLEPLSAHPNTGGVGGTEWKRATELASDIFERCPGRAFILNVTEFKPAWEYRWNAIIPASLAQAPYEGIVHASEIPYIFGPSIAPIYITAPDDISLSQVAQKAWISFAAHLDPNRLGDLTPGTKWPRYTHETEQVLVFQKGAVQLFAEKDGNDRPACDFIIAHDADLVR